LNKQLEQAVGAVVNNPVAEKVVPTATIGFGVTAALDLIPAVLGVLAAIMGLLASYSIFRKNWIEIRILLEKDRERKRKAKERIDSGLDCKRDDDMGGANA
jgi:hypothetical protein